MKVGDKVRYVKDVSLICSGRSYIVKSHSMGNYYNLGDEEVLSEIMSNIEEYKASVLKKYGELPRKLPQVIFPFVRIGDWGYAPAACFELVTPPPHKCTCPAVNFAFNGIGCKCGGI